MADLLPSSEGLVTARIGYADPPYPGMSGFYKDHPDYGGEASQNGSDHSTDGDRIPGV